VVVFSRHSFRSREMMTPFSLGLLGAAIAGQAPKPDVFDRVKHSLRDVRRRREDPLRLAV